MDKLRRGGAALMGLFVLFVFSACAGSHMTRTPGERAMWKAAEEGHPEAQRRVANDLRPDSEPGGARPDSGHAAYWFRTACEQSYANAAVDFYEFAEDYRIRTGDERHLDHALPCLQEAIDQGHRGAITVGAARAEKIENNYERAFFLYALLDESDPKAADHRWQFADKLTLDAPDRLQRRADEWLSRHSIRGHDDFLREQSASSRSESGHPSPH